MDTKDISEMIELLSASDLTEIEIERDGYKLRLSRVGMIAAPMMQQIPIAPMAQGAGANVPEAEDANCQVIKSPIVGTFYRSPSPESPIFASIGDKVSSTSVVCIIEAMKVMNEIQADVSGEITEILVENGQTVEFGQPLFKVKSI